MGNRCSPRERAAVLVVVLFMVALVFPASAARPNAQQPMDGESWDLFKKVFGMVLRDYVDPKTPQDVIKGALQGAASSVGPECAYIPPEKVAAYKALAKAGPQLPMYVTKDKDFARVLAVFPGQNADIRPGDALRFIGDESTYDLTYPEVLIALRGQDDKGIKCTFLNQESWQSTSVTLTRTLPAAPTWTPLPGADGALSIPCLEAKLSSHAANAIRACRGTVVVDLRNSASGSVADAIRWAGDLIGPGRSALFESKRGTIERSAVRPRISQGKAHARPREQNHSPGGRGARIHARGRRSDRMRRTDIRLGSKVRRLHTAKRRDPEDHHRVLCRTGRQGHERPPHPAGNITDNSCRGKRG